MLACAGVSLIYNMITDYQAGRRAQQVLAEMLENSSPDAYLPDSNDLIDYVPPPDEATADSDAAAEPREESAEEAAPPSGEAAQQEAPPPPSYTTIGVLSIPSLKINLPLLDECDDSLLKISICRYKGFVEPQPTRLVVAGHNYKSHFGRIPKLNIGDEVCFTNRAGEQYYFTVSELTEVAANDHAGLASGEWDITMFTCTPDGSRRILVRCQAI